MGFERGDFYSGGNELERNELVIVYLGLGSNLAEGWHFLPPVLKH